ncbi:MAG: hypothetical protein M3O62_09280 [Pseudomonadota bacterium]|nr:hypothetical protein [Pseudomonadota bacterium]
MIAFPDFSGGVHVAACDLDDDGMDGIVVGAGTDGAPKVRVFSGADTGVQLADFAAYPGGFTGGSVAAARSGGDGLRHRRCPGLVSGRGQRQESLARSLLGHGVRHSPGIRPSSSAASSSLT